MSPRTLMTPFPSTGPDSGKRGPLGRTRAVVASAAAAAVLTACSGMAAGQAPVPGSCYFFEQTEETASLRLPQGIRLTDRPLEGWPAIMQRGEVLEAVTLTRDGPADYPFGYWLQDDEGVEIGYPAGGGIVLELQPDGGALEGTAAAMGDARPYGESQDGPGRVSVRLEPGACPAS